MVLGDRERAATESRGLAQQINETSFLAFGDSITTGVLCPPTCADAFGLSMIDGSAGDPWSYPAVLLQLNVRYKTRVAPRLTGINDVS